MPHSFAATFPPGVTDAAIVAVSPPPVPHALVGGADVLTGNTDSLDHVEGATVPADPGNTKSNGGGSFPWQLQVLG